MAKKKKTTPFFDYNAVSPEETVDRFANATGYFDRGEQFRDTSNLQLPPSPSPVQPEQPTAEQRGVLGSINFGDNTTDETYNYGLGLEQTLYNTALTANDDRAKKNGHEWTWGEAITGPLKSAARQATAVVAGTATATGIALGHKGLEEFGDKLERGSRNVYDKKKDYTLEEMVPFASNYWTNPAEGAISDIVGMAGSALAIRYLAMFASPAFKALVTMNGGMGAALETLPMMTAAVGSKFAAPLANSAVISKWLESGNKVQKAIANKVVNNWTRLATSNIAEAEALEATTAGEKLREYMYKLAVQGGRMSNVLTETVSEMGNGVYEDRQKGLSDEEAMRRMGKIGYIQAPMLTLTSKLGSKLEQQAIKGAGKKIRNGVLDAGIDAFEEGFQARSGDISGTDDPFYSAYNPFDWSKDNWKEAVVGGISSGGHHAGIAAGNYLLDKTKDKLGITPVEGTPVDENGQPIIPVTGEKQNAPETPVTAPVSEEKPDATDNTQGEQKPVTMSVREAKSIIEDYLDNSPASTEDSRLRDVLAKGSDEDIIAEGMRIKGNNGEGAVSDNVSDSADYENNRKGIADAVRNGTISLDNGLEAVNRLIDNYAQNAHIPSGKVAQMKARAEYDLLSDTTIQGENQEIADNIKSAMNDVVNNLTYDNNVKNVVDGFKQALSDAGLGDNQIKHFAATLRKAMESKRADIKANGDAIEQQSQANGELANLKNLENQLVQDFTDGKISSEDAIKQYERAVRRVSSPANVKTRVGNLKTRLTKAAKNSKPSAKTDVKPATKAETKTSDPNDVLNVPKTQNVSGGKNKEPVLQAIKNKIKQMCALKDKDTKYAAYLEAYSMIDRAQKGGYIGSKEGSALKKLIEEARKIAKKGGDFEAEINNYKSPDPINKHPKIVKALSSIMKKAGVKIVMDNSFKDEAIRKMGGKFYGWDLDGGMLLMSDDGVIRSVKGFYNKETGTVWLAPNSSADSVIHEYTHLWLALVKERNPRLYNAICNTIKTTDIYKQIASGKLAGYKNISEDDRISEALAFFTEAQGQAELDKLAGNRTTAQKVMDLLHQLWATVKDFLDEFTDEDLSKLTPEEVANMSMKALFEGRKLDKASLDAEMQAKVPATEAKTADDTALDALEEPEDEDEDDMPPEAPEEILKSVVYYEPDTTETSDEMEETNFGSFPKTIAGIKLKATDQGKYIDINYGNMLVRLCGGKNAGKFTVWDMEAHMYRPSETKSSTPIEWDDVVSIIEQYGKEKGKKKAETTPVSKPVEGTPVKPKEAVKANPTVEVAPTVKAEKMKFTIDDFDGRRLKVMPDKLFGYPVEFTDNNATNKNGIPIGRYRYGKAVIQNWGVGFAVTYDGKVLNNAVPNLDVAEQLISDAIKQDASAEDVPVTPVKEEKPVEKPAEKPVKEQPKTERYDNSVEDTASFPAQIGPFEVKAEKVNAKNKKGFYYGYNYGDFQVSRQNGEVERYSVRRRLPNDRWSGYISFDTLAEAKKYIEDNLATAPTKSLEKPTAGSPIKDGRYDNTILDNTMPQEIAGRKVEPKIKTVGKEGSKVDRYVYMYGDFEVYRYNGAEEKYSVHRIKPNGQSAEGHPFSNIEDVKLFIESNIDKEIPNTAIKLNLVSEKPKAKAKTKTYSLDRVAFESPIGETKSTKVTFQGLPAVKYGDYTVVGNTKGFLVFGKGEHKLFEVKAGDKETLVIYQVRKYLEEKLGVKAEEAPAEGEGVVNAVEGTEETAPLEIEGEGDNATDRLVDVTQKLKKMLEGKERNKPEMPDSIAGQEKKFFTEDEKNATMFQYGDWMVCLELGDKGYMFKVYPVKAKKIFVKDEKDNTKLVDLTAFKTKYFETLDDLQRYVQAVEEGKFVTRNPPKAPEAPREFKPIVKPETYLQVNEKLFAMIQGTNERSFKYGDLSKLIGRKIKSIRTRDNCIKAVEAARDNYRITEEDAENFFNMIDNLFEKGIANTDAEAEQVLADAYKNIIRMGEDIVNAKKDDLLEANTKKDGTVVENDGIEKWANRLIRKVANELGTKFIGKLDETVIRTWQDYLEASIEARKNNVAYDISIEIPENILHTPAMKQMLEERKQRNEAFENNKAKIRNLIDQLNKDESVRKSLVKLYEENVVMDILAEFLTDERSQIIFVDKKYYAVRGNGKIIGQIGKVEYTAILQTILGEEALKLRTVQEGDLRPYLLKAIRSYTKAAERGNAAIYTKWKKLLALFENREYGGKLLTRLYTLSTNKELQIYGDKDGRYANITIGDYWADSTNGAQEIKPIFDGINGLENLPPYAQAYFVEAVVMLRSQLNRAISDIKTFYLTPKTTEDLKAIHKNNVLRYDMACEIANLNGEQKEDLDIPMTKREGDSDNPDVLLGDIIARCLKNDNPMKEFNEVMQELNETDSVNFYAVANKIFKADAAFQKFLKAKNNAYATKIKNMFVNDEQEGNQDNGVEDAQDAINQELDGLIDSDVVDKYVKQYYNYLSDKYGGRIRPKQEAKDVSTVSTTGDNQTDIQQGASDELGSTVGDAVNGGEGLRGKPNSAKIRVGLPQPQGERSDTSVPDAGTPVRGETGDKQVSSGKSDVDELHPRDTQSGGSTGDVLNGIPKRGNITGFGKKVFKQLTEERSGDGTVRQDVSSQGAQGNDASKEGEVRKGTESTGRVAQGNKGEKGAGEQGVAPTLRPQGKVKLADKDDIAQTEIYQLLYDKDGNIVMAYDKNGKPKMFTLNEGQIQAVSDTEHSLYVKDNPAIVDAAQPGNGKTFDALAVVQRLLVRKPDARIIILAPSDSILSQWQIAARKFCLPEGKAVKTKDGPSQITYVTYTSFHQNPLLISVLNGDCTKALGYDLVICDESQELGSSGTITPSNNGKGMIINPTKALTGLRALAGLDYYGFKEALGKVIRASAGKQEGASLYQIAKKEFGVDFDTYAKARFEETKQATKVLFLSATPVAYSTNLHNYIDFLFDLNKGSERNLLGYTKMEDLHRDMGWKAIEYMKVINHKRVPVVEFKQDSYNHQLEAEVANALVRMGSMTTRDAVLPMDTNTEFILGTTKGRIGEYQIGDGTVDVGELMDVINSNDSLKEALSVASARIDAYMESALFLNFIPTIRKYLKTKPKNAEKFKIILFHKFVKDTGENGLANPFILTDKEMKKLNSMQLGAYNKFLKMYPEVHTMLDIKGPDLSKMCSVVSMAKQVFGNDILTINGEMTGKTGMAKREANQAYFNDDKVRTGKYDDETDGDLIACAVGAGSTGINLNDNKGNAQRVIINVARLSEPALYAQMVGRGDRTNNLTNTIILNGILANQGKQWDTTLDRASSASFYALGSEGLNYSDFLSGKLYDALNGSVYNFNNIITKDTGDKAAKNATRYKSEKTNQGDSTARDTETSDDRSIAVIRDYLRDNPYASAILSYGEKYVYDPLSEKWVGEGGDFVDMYSPEGEALQAILDADFDVEKAIKALKSEDAIEAIRGGVEYTESNKLKDVVQTNPRFNTSRDGRILTALYGHMKIFTTISDYEEGIRIWHLKYGKNMSPTVKRAYEFAKDGLAPSVWGTTNDDVLFSVVEYKDPYLSNSDDGTRENSLKHIDANSTMSQIVDALAHSVNDIACGNNIALKMLHKELKSMSPFAGKPLYEIAETTKGIRYLRQVCLDKRDEKALQNYYEYMKKAHTMNPDVKAPFNLRSLDMFIKDMMSYKVPGTSERFDVPDDLYSEKYSDKKFDSPDDYLGLWHDRAFYAINKMLDYQPASEYQENDILRKVDVFPNGIPTQYKTPENAQEAEAQARSKALTHDNRNLVTDLFRSPSWLSKSFSTYKPFFEAFAHASKTQEMLRNRFIGKWNKLVTENLKTDAQREAFNNLMMIGDLFQQDFSLADLGFKRENGKYVEDKRNGVRSTVVEGVDANVAKAYLGVRQLIRTLWKLQNNAHRNLKKKTRGSMTPASIRSLLTNKLVENVMIRPQGSNGILRAVDLNSLPTQGLWEVSYEVPKISTMTDEFTIEQLDAMIAAKNFIVPPMREWSAINHPDGSKTYRVTIQYARPDIGRIEGYVPHIFGNFSVILRTKELVVDNDGMPILDENGDLQYEWSEATVVDSADKIGDARDKGKVLEEIYLKSHPEATTEDVQLSITPKVFHAENYWQDVQPAYNVSTEYGYMLADEIARKFKLSIGDVIAMLGSQNLPSSSHNRFNRHFESRKGNKGYSDDIYKIIPQYINTATRYIALQEVKPYVIDKWEATFNHKWGDALTSDEYLAKIMKRYIERNNGTPSDLERGASRLLNCLKNCDTFNNWLAKYGDRTALGFGTKLNGYAAQAFLGCYNIAAGMVNLVQLQNTFAYIGLDGLTKGFQHAWGILKWSKTKGKHFNIQNGKKIPIDMPAQIRKDLKILHDSGAIYRIGMNSSGYTKTREVMNYGKAKGPLYEIKKFFRKISDNSMMFFSGADAICRYVTTLGSYYTAIENGDTHKQALGFARDMDLACNFEYGTYDAPGIFREASGTVIGDLALLFQKYPVKEFEIMSQMIPWLSKETNWKEKSRFWGSFFFLTGLTGMMPGLDWLDEIWNKLLGYRPSQVARGAFLELVGDNSTVRNALAGNDVMLALYDGAVRTTLYGLPAVFPSIDISRRVGLGNIIPVRDSLYEMMFGAAGSYFAQLFRAVNQMYEGKNNAEVRFLKAFIPSLGNLAEALQGYRTNNNGNIMYRYDNPFEWLGRAVGFRSAGEAVRSDKKAYKSYTEKNPERKEALERVASALVAKRKPDDKDIRIAQEGYGKQFKHQLQEAMLRMQYTEEEIEAMKANKRKKRK